MPVKSSSLSNRPPLLSLSFVFISFPFQTLVYPPTPTFDLFPTKRPWADRRASTVYYPVYIYMCIHKNALMMDSKRNILFSDESNQL